MGKNKILYVVILTFCWLGSITSADAQKKYEEIYINLPNWSVDQAYSELMDFQRLDPYFPNVYLQLGMICERKLFNTDPLREVETTKFWAKNAELFFGNFKVFYKEDDARHSDYYENLQIPQAGKRITDAEVMAFVDKHSAYCKNFADTTVMLYETLERSKKAYNNSLAIYSAICDKYTDINDALLRHDATLAAQFKELETNVNECISQFKEYKRILNLHPLLNYRQIYDVKNIQTFRLDGLTNTDFLLNRFVIWDYSSWIKEYNDALQNGILPLRKEIESINAVYAQRLEDYNRNKRVEPSESKPYDELFLFRLGRYDNNSLVRELFAYLDARQALIEMVQDPMALPSDSLPQSLTRRMRHVNRTVSQYGEAVRAVDYVNQYVSADRINRFKDFFQKNYGGEKGLKNYSKTETERLQGISQRLLNNFAAYLENIKAVMSEHKYSDASGNLPALPMWEIAEDADLTQIQGQYLTRCIDVNSYGNASYVAGERVLAGKQGLFVAAISDGKVTKWTSPINKTEKVRAVRACANGCVVLVSEAGTQSLVYFDDKGKELKRVEAPSGNMQLLVENQINGTSVLTFRNDNSTTVCTMDSLQNPVATAELLDIKSIHTLYEIPSGYFVIGATADGSLSAYLINKELKIEKNVLLGEQRLSFAQTFRASAQEICIFATDPNGQLHYISLSPSLEIKHSL